MRGLPLASGIAASVILFVGCSGSVPEEASERKAQVSSPLWVATSELWSSPLINVCLESSAIPYTTEVGWLQSALSQTWEAVSNVVFTWSGACTPNQSGIHLSVGNGSSTGRGGGFVAVQLDFTFSLPGTNIQFPLNAQYFPNDTTPPFHCTDSTAQRQKCISVMGVHEFGHALGWLHEQDNPSATTPCEIATKTGQTNGLPLWAVDEQSIMSYCSPVYRDIIWPWTLSPGDTEGTQAIYGAPPQSLIGENGLCLTVSGGNYNYSVEPMLVPCTGGGYNQRWSFSPQGGTLTGQGWCYDDPAGNVNDGTNPALWSCNGGQNQNWLFGSNDATSYVMIRGLASKCLDVLGSPLATAHIIYNDCDPSATSQKWHYDSGHRFENQAGSGMCLDLTGANTINGTLLELWPCTGNPNQVWNIQSGTTGNLRSGLNANKCIDLRWNGANYGTANRTPIEIWDCNGGLNQRWAFNGVISTTEQNVGTKCLDIPNWDTTKPPELWDCNGGSNQQWIYYP
jgi:Ricin-type beta-trefoil lectin domain